MCMCQNIGAFDISHDGPTTSEFSVTGIQAVPTVLAPTLEILRTLLGAYCPFALARNEPSNVFDRSIIDVSKLGFVVATRLRALFMLASSILPSVE